MKWFKNVTTVEELRKEYRRCQFHFVLYCVI